MLLACAQDRFPLHFIVFKQVSSHIPHEGNVEQLFSRSGYLSDPKQHGAGLPRHADHSRQEQGGEQFELLVY